jgi:hypothetical protein
MADHYALRDIGVEELQPRDLREAAWKAILHGQDIRIVAVTTTDMPEVLQVLWLNGRAGFAWGGDDHWNAVRWINVETIEQAIEEYLSNP